MKRDDKIRREQVRIIYGQSLTAIIGGILAALIFLWVSWNEFDRTISLAWAACFVAPLMVRAALYVKYLRDPDWLSLTTWLNTYTFFSFVQGALWAIVWLLFLPESSDPGHSFTIAYWMLGLAASSVIAYAVHLPTMLAFFIPVMAPTTLFLLINNHRFSQALVAGILLWSTVLIRSYIPINRAMLKSIDLNHQREEEIHRRMEIEEQLRELSFKDGLSGVANRRRFDEVLNREYQRSRRNSSPLSLVMLDIDYFKAYNDIYGHLEGDKCLIRVAAAIQGCLHRPGDLVARYGGEEFAVILPETGARGARTISESIRKKILDINIPHRGTAIKDCSRLTVSAGVATVNPTWTQQAEDVVRRADRALYRAKENGRNQTMVST